MNRLEALGAVIRETRKLNNVSQEKLAATAKLHRNAMGRIERGDVAVTVGSLWVIADALNVSPSELMSKAELLAKD